MSKALTMLFTALANLESNHPDLHARIAGMPLVSSDRATSLGTNGNELQYSTEFVEQCTQEQADYLVAFIAQMKIEDPLNRVKDPDTDYQTWHMAANVVVNRKLRQRGLENPIAGSLDYPEMDDLDIDQVYDRMRNERVSKLILERASAAKYVLE